MDGWYKIRLLRDDGRVVKVNKSRYRALREKGQIVEDKTCEEP